MGPGWIAAIGKRSASFLGSKFGVGPQCLPPVSVGMQNGIGVCLRDAELAGSIFSSLVISKAMRTDRQVANQENKCK